MAGRASKPPVPKNELDVPYLHGDLIPVPEAVEKHGESVWALFNEISREHENRFADTAPASGPMKLAASETGGWAQTRPMDSGAGRTATPRRSQAQSQALFTLDAAMLVARRNNRVCPRPQSWEKLSALLAPRKTMRGLQQPPAPMTGAAWAVTPSLTKRLCFREQIEWAERQGVLESIMAFMQALPEEDWLHMGED